MKKQHYIQQMQFVWRYGRGQIMIGNQLFFISLNKEKETVFFALRLLILEFNIMINDDSFTFGFGFTHIPILKKANMYLTFEYN